MNDFLNRTGRLEEERTIQEEFFLTSEDAGQVPKTVTRDGVEYALDENSVVLQVSKKELWKEQEVMEEYVSYAVEDNDIERLQKEITRDGRALELIGVEYQVTETTESGLPLAYEALCRYAANVDRDREVPVQWKATASYTGTVEEAAPGTGMREDAFREEEALRQEETEEHAGTGENEISGIPGAEAPAETEAAAETKNAPEAAAVERGDASGETEDLKETGVLEETEALAEEAVPMAASLEESAVPLNDAAAGVMGIVLLSSVFAWCILMRRKNRVAVYARGGEEKGRFLGKTFARQEKGFWIIPIPERLLKLSGAGTGELVLKPSGRVLRGRPQRAKIVSPAGTFYKEIKDTMDLWEDHPSGLGQPALEL